MLPRAFIKLVTSILASIILFSCGGEPNFDIKSKTFQFLEEKRIDKRDEVISFLENLLKKIHGAKQDEFLIETYKRFYRSHPNQMKNIRALRFRVDEMDKHYVKNYGEFYDILFVKEDGDVFYSLKMESDFRDNFFVGQIADTKLAAFLPSVKDVGFVDFDYYAPSRELASFFVMRIDDSSDSSGWLIFQLSLNSINSILFNEGRFKRTGEVYLTNQNKIMLTQSRFINDDTPLNLKVDTKSLDEAMNGNDGNMIIRDYRGVRVFSSFERFKFLGATWVVVAEIDEDEVITDHFAENRDYYLERIFQNSTKGNIVSSALIVNEEKTVRVDINEFAKGEKGDILRTFGVATCTGIVVRHGGEFAYLGHIYPLDESYLSPADKFLTNLGLWVSERSAPFGVGDLLGQILEDIRHYKIYPYQARQLKVVLMAVHTNGFGKIIDKLLKADFFLSQIKVLYDPDKLYANVVSDVGEETTLVQWVDANGKTSGWNGSSEVPNLGEWVKKISGYSL